MPTRCKTTALQFGELDDLPLALDVPQAARVVGVSRDAAYATISRGEWPTPVVRFGKSIRIPTAPLLAALGIEPNDALAQVDGV